MSRLQHLKVNVDDNHFKLSPTFLNLWKWLTNTSNPTFFELIMMMVMMMIVMMILMMIMMMVMIYEDFQSNLFELICAVPPLILQTMPLIIIAPEHLERLGFSFVFFCHRLFVFFVVFLSFNCSCEHLARLHFPFCLFVAAEHLNRLGLRFA